MEGFAGRVEEGVIGSQGRGREWGEGEVSQPN